MLSFFTKGEVLSTIKGLILSVFLMLIVALFYLTLSAKSAGIQGTNIMNFISVSKGKSGSDFIFKTVNGKTIEMDVHDKEFHIKGMENKTIFLKVFGWECDFCKKEIPQLIDLKKRLGDSFEVIAVEAQNHTKEESLGYMRKYGINYDIVLGKSYGDFYAYLQEKYGWTGIIPLTLVISKKGKVLAFELGAKSYSLSELMKASLQREESE